MTAFVPADRASTVVTTSRVLTPDRVLDGCRLVDDFFVVRFVETRRDARLSSATILL